MHKDRIGTRRDPESIRSQEGVCHSERNPLVTVDKWVILGQALPECRSMLNKVRIVACLRAKESSFDQTQVTDSWCTSESAQLACMNLKNVR